MQQRINIQLRAAQIQNDIDEIRNGAGGHRLYPGHCYGRRINLYIQMACTSIANQVVCIPHRSIRSDKIRSECIDYHDNDA